MARRSQEVSALLERLEHPHKPGIERLRASILKLDPRITEEVKWNAPSFRIDDHFATFRLHPPKHIQLILHTGATAKDNSRKFKVDDPEGLLKWPATDRCVLTLSSSAELARHEASVLRMIRQWMEQL